MAYHSIKKSRLKSLSSFLIFGGVALLILTYGPILKDEIWFFIKELKSQEYVLAGNDAPSGSVNDSVFARYLSTKPVSIEPVNRDFSMVIERIGVNAPIVRDISVVNEKAYMSALKSGIAHAALSKYPSDKPGNTYLFAHASVDFWKLGKYATVFNLLRKLDMGDRIHLFFEGKTYIYEVVNKEVHEGWNTYPITRSVIEPTLTLQTCDPPGTTKNRLVVTANLIEVQE